MLRFLITVAIIVGLWFVGDAINGKYKEIKAKNENQSQAPPAQAAPPAPLNELAGLPVRLESSLQSARAQGPAALKRWLDANRRHLQDPKLGEIELDYAVMLSRQNFAGAREVYRDVKARTPSNSPLQPKLKRLAATYE